MSVHGTAQFATASELRGEGLLHGPDASRPAAGIHLGFWYDNEYSIDQVRYDGDLHQLIVAGTGGGKFTTAIAPMLLDASLATSTVVVVDPKGEVAQLVGPFFQAPYAAKPTIFLLDPWDESGTGHTSVLNVLDQLTPENPNYVDDARALADALIISSGAENTHWDNAARNFLTGLLLYVALHPKEEGKRDLLRVREIVALPWALRAAYQGPKREALSDIVFDLIDSELAEGAVKRACTTIINREDKERSGIISSAARDTAWIDSPQMKRVLRGPSIDMKEAALDGNKYFVILPPDYFETHRAWLRLVVITFAKAFRRHRFPASALAPRRWRHIVIDEFANLGEMSFILNDIAVSRAYGIKYTFAVQGLSQLSQKYGEGWQTFINNTFQRFFMVSDMFTADYVSRMAGSATVDSITVSQGLSDSRTHGVSKGWSETTSISVGESTAIPQGEGSPTQTYSFTKGVSHGSSETLSDSTTSGSSRGTSVTQVQRSLITADEVRRVSSRDQLLFMRGLQPISNWRLPYWESFERWSPPPLSLNDLLETVGKDPSDTDLLERYAEWKSGLTYKKPKPLPAPAPASAPAPTLAPPLVPVAAPALELPSWLGRVSATAFLVLLFVSWLWPVS